MVNPQREAIPRKMWQRESLWKPDIVRNKKVEMLAALERRAGGFDEGINLGGLADGFENSSNVSKITHGGLGKDEK